MSQVCVWILKPSVPQAMIISFPNSNFVCKYTCIFSLLTYIAFLRNFDIVLANGVMFETRRLDFCQLNKLKKLRVVRKVIYK